MSQWNASVVTLKVISSILDDTFQWMMKIISYMQLTHHGIMHLQRWIVQVIRFFCFVFFVFRSHTFVVWVNSLRTADLTRNVKVGEGTGQVNINPDKSTMLGWNFDRIITYNRHKTPQYTVYSQESKAQTDRLEQTQIFRDTLHIKSLVTDKK